MTLEKSRRVSGRRFGDPKNNNTARQGRRSGDPTELSSSTSPRRGNASAAQSWSSSRIWALCYAWGDRRCASSWHHSSPALWNADGIHEARGQQRRIRGRRNTCSMRRGPSAWPGPALTFSL